jgi:hypothetical protein
VDEFRVSEADASENDSDGEQLGRLGSFQQDFQDGLVALHSHFVCENAKQGVRVIVSSP